MSRKLLELPDGYVIAPKNHVGDGNTMVTRVNQSQWIILQKGYASFGRTIAETNKELKSKWIYAIPKPIAKQTSMLRGRCGCYPKWYKDGKAYFVGCNHWATNNCKSIPQAFDAWNKHVKDSRNA